MRESDDSKEKNHKEGARAAEASTCAGTQRIKRHMSPHSAYGGWPT
jgi:hypothetical protein